MVTVTFGDMLFQGADFGDFPSPESLKRQILISTKLPRESVDCLKEEESSECDKNRNNCSMQIQVG